MLKQYQSCYFLIRNTGIRIWFNPRFWRWQTYRNGQISIVHDLGPVTIYKG